MDNQEQQIPSLEGMARNARPVVLSDEEKSVLAAVREQIVVAQGKELPVLEEFENFCATKPRQAASWGGDLTAKFDRFIEKHAEAGKNFEEGDVTAVRAAISAQTALLSQAAISQNSPSPDGAGNEVVAPGAAEQGGEPAVVAAATGEGLANKAPEDVSAAADFARQTDEQDDSLEDIGSAPPAPAASTTDSVPSVASVPTAPATGGAPAGVAAPASGVDQAVVNEAAFRQGQMSERQTNADTHESLDAQSRHSREVKDKEKAEAAAKAEDKRDQQERMAAARDQQQGRPMGALEFLFRSFASRIAGKPANDVKDAATIPQSGPFIPRETLEQWITRSNSFDERVNKLSQDAAVLAALGSSGDEAAIAAAKRQVEESVDAVKRGFHSDANELMREVNEGNISQESATEMLVQRQVKVDDIMNRVIDGAGVPAPAAKAADGAGEQPSAAEKSKDPAAAPDADKKDGVKAYLGEMAAKLQDALKSMIENFVNAVKSLITPKKSSGPRPG